MKFKPLFFVLILSLLGGCATVSTSNDSKSSSVDPFEKLNRSTFEFNEVIDEHVFQPAARAYVTVLPSFAQTGIQNFYGNINDVWTAANSFMQGNAHDGCTDLMRVGLNSTFGVLGVVDIASEINIPKHNSDFGQTLAVWGVPNGPYLVLPFLGSTVVRDAVALPLDYYANLWSYYRPLYIRNIGSTLFLVDKRASYLDATSLLEDAALDKYIFVRDAYLQRLGGQIESRRNDKNEREDVAEMKLDKTTREINITVKNQ